MSAPTFSDEYSKQALEFIQAAEKETSLHDWGTNKELVLESLRLFFRMLDEQPLSIDYRFRYKAHTIKENLKQRLRVVHEINLNLDEVDAQEITSPLFIIGLNRTASTRVHRLISLDPANRSPFTWEVMYPTSELSKEEKIAKAKAFFNHFDEVAPTLRKIHPFDAECVEECMFVMRLFFFHMEFLIMPGHQFWWFLENQIWCQELYTFHKRLMQYFQLQETRREKKVPTHQYWTFKAPTHLFFLDQIVKVYPNAQFVWLHRNPKDALNSMQTLSEATFGETEEGFIRKTADFSKQVQSTSLRLAMKEIESWPLDTKNKVFHVYYDDFVKDPYTEIVDIYYKLGRKCPDEFLESLRNETEKDKSRGVTRLPERYTDKEIDQEFAEYLAKFFPQK